MRRRGTRLILLGPLLAVLLVASTACHGAGTKTGVASAGDATAGPRASSSSAAGGAQAQAQKYAQCIRDHGVPDFPDPDPSGRFTGGGLQGVNRDALTKAAQACQDQAPPGVSNAFDQMTPDQADQFRKFAGCMRDHGINVPDPDPNGSLATWAQSWNNTIDTADPKFQKAAQTCQANLNLPRSGQ